MSPLRRANLHGPTLDDRGMTLAEILVAATVALIVLGGAMPVFMMNRQGLEQHSTVRDVQMEVHTSTELILRLVRNADGVREGGTDSRVVLEGGDAQPLCGAPACALEVDDDGLKVVSADAGVGHERMLAPHARELVLTYGMDDDDDGGVDGFVTAVPGGRAGDVMALRLRLEYESAEGRGRFSTTTDFVAVMRGPVVQRVDLQGGGS